MSLGAALTDRRRRLASSVLARAASHPVVHAVQHDIVARPDVASELRRTALAIVRVELLARSRWWRGAEYAALIGLGFARPSLTIGPAQLQVRHLRRRVAACPCGCASGRRLTRRSIVARPHYVSCFLAHVGELSARLPTWRAVANAYHKGSGAADLDVPTVYSEVVCALRHRFVTSLEGAGWVVAERGGGLPTPTPAGVS